LYFDQLTINQCFLVPYQYGNKKSRSGNVWDEDEDDDDDDDDHLGCNPQ